MTGLFHVTAWTDDAGEIRARVRSTVDVTSSEQVETTLQGRSALESALADWLDTLLRREE